MATFQNGDTRQVSYQAVELRIIPNDGKKNPKNAGKYAVRCVPVAGDPVNESGNFFMTDKQLAQHAAGFGLGDWTLLSTLISEGDVTLHVTARFCEEGTVAPDDESVVYSTDWWKVEDTAFELGDASKDLLRDVVLKLAVESNKTAIAEHKRTAAAGRMKALLAMAKPSQKAAVNATPAEEPEDDDLELDEKPAKGRRK